MVGGRRSAPFLPDNEPKKTAARSATKTHLCLYSFTNRKVDSLSTVNVILVSFWFYILQ
jgi:hypothetical protein